MANMIRIDMRKEREAYVVDNQILESKTSIGYEVYACCDELHCWIGNCTDINTLEEIVSEEELITSMEESCSEYELNLLMSVLECRDYQYEFFGKIRKAIKGER